jgi:hypothetical protein
MRLFEVDNDHRVRIKSNVVTYQDELADTVLGRDVVWEGTTTDYYCHYRGAMRRLIRDPNIKFHYNNHVWSRDLECEDLGKV